MGIPVVVQPLDPAAKRFRVERGVSAHLGDEAGAFGPFGGAVEEQAGIPPLEAMGLDRRRLLGPEAGGQTSQHFLEAHGPSSNVSKPAMCPGQPVVRTCFEVERYQPCSRRRNVGFSRHMAANAA
jgi:hypothetical protein